MRTSLAHRPLLVALSLLLAPASLAAGQAPSGAPGSRTPDSGTLGIEAAKAGGVVIACRHAITSNTDENELTLRYDDPSTQRRLSEAGERQAEAMGRAFRALRIPAGDVVASAMDRARRTAELMFGQVRIDSIWFNRGGNYAGPARERRAEILGTPVERGNRIIVSHVGTLASVIPPIRGQFEEGDCVVIRPRGGSRHDFIEVVPWRAWLRAAGIAAP